MKHISGATEDAQRLAIQAIRGSLWEDIWSSSLREARRDTLQIRDQLLEALPWQFFYTRQTIHG